MTNIFVFSQYDKLLFAASTEALVKEYSTKLALQNVVKTRLTVDPSLIKIEPSTEWCLTTLNEHVEGVRRVTTQEKIMHRVSLMMTHDGVFILDDSCCFVAASNVSEAIDKYREHLRASRKRG